MPNLSWKMMKSVHAWLRAFVGYAVTLTLLNLGVEWAALFTGGLLIILELLDETRRKGWTTWNFLDPEGGSMFDIFVGVLGIFGALALWRFAV